MSLMFTLREYFPPFPVHWATIGNVTFGLAIQSLDPICVRMCRRVSVHWAPGAVVPLSALTFYPHHTLLNPA